MTSTLTYTSSVLFCTHRPSQRRRRRGILKNHKLCAIKLRTCHKVVPDCIHWRVVFAVSSGQIECLVVAEAEHNRSHLRFVATL